MAKRILILSSFIYLVLLSGCAGQEPPTLRLATTTSTYDSGLLDILIPVFEEQANVQVDIIAVGTGQALALGKAKDVDVILVHAREKEEEFVSAGYGLFRLDVMYNDFIIVGPISDPAKIAGITSGSEAFSQIYSSQAIFASRGDDSGTHFKELAIWEMANLRPDPENGWYKSVGQGMGDTLRFANETGAYTITDRGTFISLSESLPNLTILVGGDQIKDNADQFLFNPYSVIPVTPIETAPTSELAIEFSNWLTGLEAQTLIKEFCSEKSGWPLFVPDSTQWLANQ